MIRRNTEELKSLIEADISAYEGILKRDLPARPSCIYAIREQLTMLKSDLERIDLYQSWPIPNLDEKEDSDESDA